MDLHTSESQELKSLAAALDAQSRVIRFGGGSSAAERQHSKGRLTARERIEQLVDPGTPILEIGLWAAWGMYESWGGAPAAGVVTAIGTVSSRRHMIVANDVTRVDSGFDSDLNEATLITADREELFPLGPKTDLASRILDRAEQLLHVNAQS